MLETLSAIERSAAHAFTKVVSVCAMAHDEDYVLKPDVKGHMQDWLKESLPFIKRFDLDRDNYFKMVTALYRGKSPSADLTAIEVTEILAEEIKDVMQDIEIEPDILTDEFKIIRDFTRVALKSSEPALKRIINAVSHLKDTNLSSTTSIDINNQGTIAKQLASTLKKMGITSGLSISADARKKYKDTEVLKKYNKLRTGLLATPKQFIMQLVRQSGKPFLRVHEVRAALAKAKILHHSVPEGFVGYIDDQMSYYAMNKLKMKSAPLGEVKMNPAYNLKTDDTYVCKAQGETAAAPATCYTVSNKQGNTVKKFAIVKKLQADYTKIRKKWLADLKHGLEKPNTVLALCCEIVHLTSARIGSDSGLTDGKKTYGLTSLTADHISNKGNTRLFEYIGKKAQLQKHKIKGNTATNKVVIELLDELRTGKGKGDRLFLNARGKKITGTHVNKYLKALGAPKGATIHKFRTMRGTILAQEALAKSPFKNKETPASSKVVNDWLKKALEAVAEELGHFSNGKLTINTAIQNYIDPQVLEDFFIEAKARPNAMVERSILLAKENKD